MKYLFVQLMRKKVWPPFLAVPLYLGPRQRRLASWRWNMYITTTYITTIIWVFAAFDLNSIKVFGQKVVACENDNSDSPRHCFFLTIVKTMIKMSYPNFSFGEFVHWENGDRFVLFWRRLCRHQQAACGRVNNQVVLDFVHVINSN